MLVRAMVPLALLLTLPLAGCPADSGAPQASQTQSSPASTTTSPVAPPALSPAATPAAYRPTATASAPAGADPVQQALAFDAARAYQDVVALAAAEMQGRHAGTPGERKGAAYLADEFRKAGLQPLGDRGGYLQRFPMQVTEMTAVPQVTVAPDREAPVHLQFREHFRPLVGGIAGPGQASGGGYFAGYAENLTPESVQGKVVVVVPARRALRDVVTDLRRLGAVGVLATTGSQPMLKGELQAPEGDTLPVVLLTRNGFDALMRADGRDPDALRQTVQQSGDLTPFTFSGTLGLVVATETKPIEALNVVGMLPGQPDGEVIVAGAHYEEIGPDPDGVVYPAANDNASGTAVLLELARLFQTAAPRPRASIIFAGWSGHEEGLLGSQFFLNNPPVALARIKGYVNLDTVGNGSSGSLTASTEEDHLRALAAQAVDELKAAGADLTVEVQRRRGGGSDDVHFRRRSIPAIALAWGGVFPDGLIHLPEDDAGNVDPEKLRATGRVAGLLLLRLAVP